MFATNFNHVGSGKDFTNDPTLTIQANEVIETNGGQVSYVSIDQAGDFRVGDALYINQETGNVSFAATSYSLEVTGEIDVTDGTNTSTLAPTSLTVGGLQLAANTLSSVTGNIVIDPAGANKTIVQGDLGVVGILTAQVLTADALQKNDTSIAIDDTGSNGTIRLNTDNVEALRVTNTQQIGIGVTAPSAKLHVVGTSLITGITTFNSNVDIDANLNVDSTLIVTGLSTFTGAIDANGGLDVAGTTDLDNVNVSGIVTVTGAIDANGGLDVAGNTELDNVNVSGIVTATEFHTGASGSSIRVTSNSITGPSTIFIDPSGVGDNTGVVRIKGGLIVDGAQFVVQSSTISLADFNVGIATTVGSNLLLDGAGIGIGSTGIRKTFFYDYSSDSLKVSENFDVPAGKVYKIAEQEFLREGLLTIENINSSGVGTITTLDTTVGTIDYLSGTNVSYIGIGTIETLDTTIGTIDYLSNTNLNTSGIGTIETLDTTVGTIDYLSGTNVSYSGIGTVATLDTTTGTIDYLTTTNINNLGIATFVGNVVFGNISASGIITGTLDNTLTLSTSGTGLSGSATYNNSGVSTFTVTSNATDANTGGTIVARDVSGNFSAGTITANLSGNVTGNLTGTATTATNLADGANITTGTISDDRLPDLITSNINITSGISTFNSIGVSTITSEHYDTLQTRTGSSILATNAVTPLSALDLDVSVFRSAEILVQSSEATNMHLTKLLVIHDGVNAYLTEYGSIYNNTINATFDVIIAGGLMQLMVTPSTGLPTEFKVSYTAIRI